MKDYESIMVRPETNKRLIMTKRVLGFKSEDELINWALTNSVKDDENATNDKKENGDV